MEGKRTITNIEEGVVAELKEFEDGTFSLNFKLSEEKEKELENKIEISAGSIIN